MRDLLIKVCGITRQKDADAAVKLNVNLLGFIFHPKSPRCIKPEDAAAIDTGQCMRVGVFVDQSPDEILDIMRRAKLHVAQLHGDHDEAFCEKLGKMRVMKVFWPQRYGSREKFEDDLRRFAPLSRFYLFDAGLAGGGSGDAMDFSFLANLKSPKTWFLAGGLGPHNLPEAFNQCKPCGIDLNSRIEASPGRKDPELMALAIRTIRG